MTTLKQNFISLSKKYSSVTHLIETLWNEIEVSYSESARHYHTLTHLENMFSQLLEVKNQIEDYDTILFSLFYHDFIYDTSRNDNEERSAELAKEKLPMILFPTDKIFKCYNQILSTGD